MSGPESPKPGLDDIAARALAGDSGEREILFSELRVRLAAVAKRRVRPDDAEDVVQDALRIVQAKWEARSVNAGMLVFGFAVLRNVIGNYYRSAARSRSVPLDEIRPPAAPGRPPQLEAGLEWPEEPEAVRARLGAALARLGREAPRCGTIFRCVLESEEVGGGPREVSRRTYERIRREIPGLSRGGFHVALHRCRARLRAILVTLEGGTGRDRSP